MFFETISQLTIGIAVSPTRFLTRQAVFGRMSERDTIVVIVFADTAAGRGGDFGCSEIRRDHKTERK
jgi:hypothetical protein